MEFYQELTMTLADKLFCREVTCPWWLCFTFDNPVRRILQDPEKVLKGLVKEGQTAYDIGCGMGYFSIPMARLVGSSGTVICVDLQQQMLDAARRRANRAGLSNIMFQRCRPDSLGLERKADFTLAFWMVHEVRDKQRFLSEIRDSLKPGGTFLLVEPKLHTTRQSFEITISIALSVGFQITDKPSVPLSMAVLLKPAAG